MVIFFDSSGRHSDVPERFFVSRHYLRGRWSPPVDQWIVTIRIGRNEHVLYVICRYSTLDTRLTMTNRVPHMPMFERPNMANIRGV